MMYCTLMDTKTKSYYMEPGEVAFHAYSSPSRVRSKPKSARLVELDIADRRELTTIFYNAGFSEGYIDDELVQLGKEDAYYFDLNYNEISFAQFLLTGNENYLQNIKKSNLLSVCKITEEGAMFPTITLEDGTIAVLAYTDKYRIPQVLYEKYEGYRVVKMAFSVKAFVNGKFVIE